MIGKNVFLILLGLLLALNFVSIVVVTHILKTFNGNELDVGTLEKSSMAGVICGSLSMFLLLVCIINVAYLIKTDTENKMFLIALMILLTFVFSFNFLTLILLSDILRKKDTILSNECERSILHSNIKICMTIWITIALIPIGMFLSYKNYISDQSVSN